jgi:hypothetical protein
VPGNTILDAVATVRDAIAYAESTNTSMCVLTLDFQQAFNKASHEYLFTILRSYGLRTRFVSLIRNLYTGATSSVHINERLYGPFPVTVGTTRLPSQYGSVNFVPATVYQPAGTTTP